MPRLRFGVLCFVCSVFAVAVGVWGPVQAQNGPEAVQNLEERDRCGPTRIPGQPYRAKPTSRRPFVPRLGAVAAARAVVGPNQNEEELTKLWSVTGSDKQFSRLDFRQADSYPDWFPGDHPAMPRMNTVGSATQGRACAGCHLANGKGRPENAPPSGQPAAYTLQQIEDFTNGLRYTSDPRKRNTHTMIWLSEGMNDAEKLEIAEYYAAIPWTPWIRVIETDLVPEMHLEEGNMFITVGTERTVPLAGRIIETPENQLESNYLRSPRSGWNAYVPVGSLAKGEELVTTGGGKTVQCGVCHGEDLMGLGSMPGIAGRSPSYMMRQLWDMKQGDTQRSAGRVDDAHYRGPDRRGHDQHRRVPGVSSAAAGAGGTTNARAVDRRAVISIAAWGLPSPRGYRHRPLRTTPISQPPRRVPTMGDLEARLIPGTETGLTVVPFFSPDGQSVGVCRLGNG